MKGRVGEKEGIFPTGFVKVLEELPKVKKEEHKPKAGKLLIVYSSRCVRWGSVQ